MRKLFTIALVGLSVYANARQITHEEAMSVASSFMNSTELRTAAENSALRPMRAPGISSNTSVSPYYIFNRGENDGFIIISGDDRTLKVLGYSDKGSFDTKNVPPQLKALMASWTKQIENISGGETHSSWTSSSMTRAEEGVLLETAEWGQGDPYNSLCPDIDGQKASAGCTATAMAIVMKYHNWPES